MPNYERARQTMRKVARNASPGEIGKLELALGIADAIGGAIDNAQNLSGLASFSGVAGAYSLLYAMAGQDDGNVLPNINFVFNGHDDADSPLTASYFKGRNLKNIGSSAMSLVGVAASASTAGVNVASAISHANATGSTAVHLIQLGRIAAKDRYKGSVTIQDWLKAVLTAKSMKAAIRGGSLVGAVIPAASLGAGIAAAVAKAGVQLTMTKVISATAAAIHWRAFQEQIISGGRGSTVGPASQIYWEIFTRRGLTRVFGSYDIPGLIREPAGWLPLKEKLLLM